MGEQQRFLAMEFKTAKIQRILDWQPLTELPEKTQGCQIVFASEGVEKYFFQKHEYEEGKDSVFTIKQSSSADQTQIIQIKEKEITVKVEESGKEKLTIKLNRDEGLLIELDHQEGGVTNSTLYSDESITHTSKGSDGTSTIIQKPDAIDVTADQVKITCKELLVDAEKAITLKGGSKVTIDTPLAKATTEMHVG